MAKGYKWYNIPNFPHYKIVGELVNDKGFYIDHSKTKIGIRCFNEDGIFKDIYFYNKNNNNHDQSKNRRNSIPKRTQT